MKNRIIKLCLLLTVMAFTATTVEAQAKKPVRKKAVRSGKNVAKSKNKPTPAIAPPPVDTVKPAPVEAKLDIPPIKKSLRNDNAIERNLVKDRIPLAYEHIREDDAVYMQRVWREIDVHEKMNLPFVYKAEGDQGNERFIYILLNAIKNDSITAFSPMDDRFTTPLPFSEIVNGLVGKPITIQVPDLAKDPDGSKGLMRDTTIVNEFNPDKVERFWIKEDWVFDKESSRMQVRILGIAPLKTITNDDGSFRDVTPIFWVYYPDLRPTFAKHEVYNGKNFGARMSWEELFESRMFASRIIKSTVNNPNDEFIKSYIKDPILALLEGDDMKERIFNYEQDLWSY
ncbi:MULTISPECIES: type IX secretion system ring subunit PorN/GldN [Niastella]|uniref:Gliding motility protein GldN n=1 Tax=Niastella soli TaxID=2821487 RepID=A0ABS3YRQ4_9BACT|nr:gliding motility protein GldN [Niastella soli]MBO9200262.1 gliding motility protein GldN [Niastella soli]